MDKRRDWGGTSDFDPPPTRELVTRRLQVPACTASSGAALNPTPPAQISTQGGRAAPWDVWSSEGHGRCLRP